MPSTLNKIMEPFFASPARRDIVRRLLFDMRKQKAMLHSAVEPSCRSVLDLGCGTGEFCDAIPAKAYHGVDTDALGIEQAKKVHPNYSFASMRDVSDIEGSYDLIALMDTVHHLSPKIFKATLDEALGRLLTKKGKLLIIDPVHPKEQEQRLGASFSPTTVDTTREPRAR